MNAKNTSDSERAECHGNKEERDRSILLGIQPPCLIVDSTSVYTEYAASILRAGGQKIEFRSFGDDTHDILHIPGLDLNNLSPNSVRKVIQLREYGVGKFHAYLLTTRMTNPQMIKTLADSLSSASKLDECLRKPDVYK
ncbi:hypothetical protein FQN53_002479 [Emmonsiellopsis sp. PD_33]|nr:hypothetical protein FQN53_002479 [Emmonsiellopsis sp. PD_33]